MLKKIKLYGRLRKFIGQSVLEADVNSPAEAISFLHCNYKGLQKHMADQFYQIIPLAHGNFFPLIFGAGALFTSSAIGTTLLGSKLLATVVSGALTSIGTSLVIDGVTQMITPQASMTSAASNMDITDPAALAANYSFTGLTNVSRAGVPINLVFGEILVGSITISNGVDTVQVEGP